MICPRRERAQTKVSWYVNNKTDDRIYKNQTILISNIIIIVRINLYERKSSLVSKKVSVDGSNR